MSQKDQLTQKHPTIVGDEIPKRLHRPTDALRLIFTTLTLFISLTLGIIAHNTNAALSEDLSTLSRGFGRLIHQPTIILVAIMTVAIPITVLGNLFTKRAFKQLVAAILASALALIIGFSAILALVIWDPTTLRQILEITTDINKTPPITISTTAICALLTVAGPRHTLNTVQMSWKILFFTLTASVLANNITLFAAILTFLLGRISGLIVRYTIGAQTDQAYGKKLVDAFFEAGLNPKKITRIPPPKGKKNLSEQYFRTYQLLLTNNKHVDVKISDQESQISGTLIQLWQNLKIRTQSNNNTLLSVRKNIEREALAISLANNFHVNLPKLITISEIKPTSMLIATESIQNLQNISKVDKKNLTNQLLDELWKEIIKLRKANLSHRSLASNKIMIDKTNKPWLTDIQDGKIATSDFNKRIDIAQMLTLQALLVGADRAIESGIKTLGLPLIISAAPLLQTVVLPKQTKLELKSQKKLLTNLREKIMHKAPEATIAPARIARFTPRSILTIIGSTTAAYLLLIQLTKVDPASIFSNANLFWVTIAIIGSILSYCGAALALVGVCPGKISFKNSFFVQIATSFVSLITPAGVGSATLNLNFLRKQGLQTSVAVATIALLQLINVFITIFFILIVNITTGSNNSKDFLPSRSLVLTVIVFLTIFALVFLFASVRNFAKQKFLPLFQQALPQFLEILGHPKKLLVAIGGSLITSFAYLLAFYASLAAFDVHISSVDLILIFFVGNFLGSAAPTPGGLGAVEASLIGGLTITAGVTAASALSIVLLYRLITFWLQVPPGWIFFRRLQKQEIL